MAALLLVISVPALATQDDSVPRSHYVQQPGEQFFLLSDSSFASDEQAKVRLEAPGRDFRRYVMEGYGGVDVRVYRVPQPLAFLQGQKNLHRLQTTAQFHGEGLANTLAYLWDSWYRQSRRAMQKAFSYQARKSVTEEAPSLSMGEAIRAPTQFAAQPQYGLIKGLQLVDQFRYPLWDAKPIAPPADVNLAGSSSEFVEAQDGNVYVPVGKLKPGLYIVEALIGNYRATTAVFVSNSVAITKIAGQDLLVWTAHKHKGNAVRGAAVLWTDGMGVLTRGVTDGEGLLRLRHASPERSYVLGEDAEGGVFVSENFYYESEVYNTKLYAITDRPLYRPGDWVEIKIIGREFKNSSESVEAATAPIELTVIDANGTRLQSINVNFTGKSGAAARFQLPNNASVGGYELRFSYQQQLYSSAFRVADYIKPHFEIVLDLAKADYRTGEAVTGQLSLLYPDGKAVANANIEISLRSQQLSMIDNELQYLGQFPVELETATLKSDAQGRAQLKLPAAEKPSRYLLTIFASDGAAFRVKTSKEILIDRGAALYRLTADKRFSAAGEPVQFNYQLESQAGRKPAQYEWIRLEDQSRGAGELQSNTQSFTLNFERPGTYNVSIKDSIGLILGCTGHAVSGAGIKASPGSIEIVLDRAEYQPGDTAEALITFPEPVNEALLTLERDQVEATALLSEGANWLQLKRLGETQYRARILVGASFAPNLAFSVLYTKGGDYSFQNAGIKVTVPSISLNIRTDREVYKPGDIVTVDLQSVFAGKPAQTRMTVSVVDEMIYALQPEIAPSIGDFFWHPRRNNVRTSASLSFISYDVALPGRPGKPSSANRSERGVKVLERPRREDVDTAAWQPDLVTDADGRARFTFKMPDSLTRWRITARAIDAKGVVGQRQSFVRSSKSLYLKWSGSSQFRVGDAPQLGLLAFNQTEDAINAQWATSINGQTQQLEVKLPPGVTYLALPISVIAAGELNSSLLQNGVVVDQLQVSLRSAPAGWLQAHSVSVDLDQSEAALALPADAQNISLSLHSGLDDLYRSTLDDLLSYPWGGVEQTASQLLPLAIAYPTLAQGEPRIADRLRLVMQNSRLRLVHMAGPNAHFSWWGGADEDAFLTAYAYYADWHASRALGLSLPPEHFQRVLDLYAQRAAQTSLLQRALILDFAQRMQLPIDLLVQGLLRDLSAAAAPAARRAPKADLALSSLILDAPDSQLGLDAARVLAARLATLVGRSVPADLHVDAAQARLASSTLAFAHAVSLYRARPDSADIRALYQRLAPEQATLERALILSWLGLEASPHIANELQPIGDWTAQTLTGGSTRWIWTGVGVPQSLRVRDGARGTGHGTREEPQPTTQTTGLLRFDSNAPSQSNLPIGITRRLWRLQPGTGAFQFDAVAVGVGESLSSDTLYLDEITLINSADKALRYGLLEVPLPPGADVERTTWGISVSGLGGTGAAQLEKARHESGELRYAVPVDTLTGTVSFRHLLRFSQKGRFHLPPVRYQRLYAPEQQALEAKPALGSIEVR